MTDPTLRLDLTDPMTPAQVVARINDSFSSLAGDKSYLQGITVAVPGAGEMYGIRVPQLRQLTRQLLTAFKPNPGMVTAIAEACWRAGSREHRVLAIMLISGLKSLSADERWAWGMRFLPAVADWETCDQLCMGVLGQALVEDPAYMEELEAWTGDANLWVRRASLACTVVLRRSKADAAVRRQLDQRSLGLCLSLLDDREHYIRKAVDWAVREVIRRDYELGKQWLLQRARSGLSATARSTLIKSARKLSPEDETHFLDALV